VAVTSAYATITFSGTINTGSSVLLSVDTGVSSTQSLWLTGYEISSSDGPVALQTVYIRGPDVFLATWEAAVAVLGLDSSATSAGVRVFYTYTA
jgi:hypothetical protein